jgi:hypothetical protein
MGSPCLSYPRTPTWDRRGARAALLYDKNRMPRESPRHAPFRLRLRRSDGAPVSVVVQCIALETARGEVYAISVTITAVESLPN